MPNPCGEQILPAVVVTEHGSVRYGLPVHPPVTQARAGEPIRFNFPLRLENSAHAEPLLYAYRGHPAVRMVTIEASTERPDFYKVIVECHASVRSVGPELLTLHHQFLGPSVRPTAWERVGSDEDAV